MLHTSEICLQTLKQPAPFNFKTDQNETISLRLGESSDSTATTRLIHEAFNVWKNLGLHLSPMFQTEEKTAQHLIKKGYVATNTKGEIVGTFSLEHGRLHSDGNTILFYEGKDSPIPFASQIDNHFDSAKTYLIFKKAAVASGDTYRGLGTAMYRHAESLAITNNYDGMLLETVKEATWLYDWYLRLGFIVIGEYIYPESAVSTVLMLKQHNSNFRASE